MARVRSPNYPALSLPDAIDRIKKVHTSQQHLPEPREVVAQHMGYGGLNGAALKSLSALIKYGLLVEETKGELKVSDRALSIIFSDTAEEKFNALLEAATEPALFSEIYDRWEGAIPSDESLKNYLVRRQFSTSAMDSVTKNYRETFELVARESVEYDSDILDDESEQEQIMQQVQPKASAPIPVSSTTGTGYNIGFLGSSIQMGGVISSKSDAQKVIDAITALQALLPNEDDQTIN